MFSRVKTRETTSIAFIASATALLLIPACKNMTHFYPRADTIANRSNPLAYVLETLFPKVAWERHIYFLFWPFPDRFGKAQRTPSPSSRNVGIFFLGLFLGSYNTGMQKPFVRVINCFEHISGFCMEFSWTFLEMFKKSIYFGFWSRESYISRNV